MKQRYYSLDVFRGATVALMILVNNPGIGRHVYSPLKHASWHGLTPADLVFPFFLFAVGNALAFVMPRLQAAGAGAFWRKVLQRTVLIFAIGLFLNWWPFLRWQGESLAFIPWTGTAASGEVQGVRIMGVLQRIALCYFAASVIIYYAKARGAFLVGAVLLLLYWLLCLLGNPADPYSLAGWFGSGIDTALLGEAHLLRRGFDPEGLVSTLPAIVQVIFGYVVGDYIMKKDSGARATSDVSREQEEKPQEKPQTASHKPQAEVSASVSTTLTSHMLPEGQVTTVPSHSPLTTHHSPHYPMLTGLFIAAVAFLFAGYAWGLSFPINKKIWTSSYVVLTTGMATAILALLIYVIEGRGRRGWWTRFFAVFGMNALFIYALSMLVPKVLRLIRLPNGVSDRGRPLYLNAWNWWYEKVMKPIPGAPEIGSLAFALSVVLFLWAVGYWLHRQKIYIKV